MHDAVWLVISIVALVVSIWSLTSTIRNARSLSRESVKRLEEEIQTTPRVNRTTDMDSTIETKFRQRTSQSFQNPVKARQSSARVRRSRRIK